MKKNITSFVVAVALFCNMGVWAQTDPGTVNLTHLWTFDDGTAQDSIGTADAAIVGGAIVDGSYVNTSITTNAGAYIDLQATESLALNTYSEITFESWAAASATTTNNSMLAYFGGQSGTLGVNHCFVTTSASRATISCLNTTTPWTVETSISGTSLINSPTIFHQQVYILKADSVFYYIDGVQQGGNVITAGSADNSIANIATTYAWLGRSGYTGDPAWLGKVTKFSIYDRALTDDEILFLYQEGPEEDPLITSTVTSIAFDDIYLSGDMDISGFNLGATIDITAPAGITVLPTSVASNASNATVTITYDGSTVVDGIITLTSGATTLDIPVKSYSNTSCYTPNAASISGNLIADPTFSQPTLADGGFGGWGLTTLDHTNPYCGNGSVYIFGSCWPDGGSLDRSLTTANGNALKATTTYRLRAMINSQATAGTSFQFQVEGVDGATSIYFQLPNTSNAWVQFDTTFTTGATVSEHGIYFNSCTTPPAITDTCWIDNYELYEDFGTFVNNARALKQDVYVVNNQIISSFDLANATNVEISVYDLQGKLLVQTNNNYNAGHNEQSINTNLSKGVYIVKMFSDEFSVTKKVVK